MKKILIIITLFFYISPISAEIIKSVKIEGNERISDETIKVYGEIKVNENVDEFKINQIIKNLYSTNFFEDIKISIQNQTLIVNLKEYPVINEIIITGEKASKFKEAIKKNIKSKKNGPFKKSFISEDEKLIKILYSTLGYNFIEINSKIETSQKKE